MDEPNPSAAHECDPGFVRPCPCCDAPMRRRFLETAYLACDACGALASTVEAAGYETDYYYHTASAEKAERRRGALEWRWARRLARARPSTLSISGAQSAIEIGCSRGYFVEKCLAQGLSIHGYDVSPVALASARARGLDRFCIQRDLIADHSSIALDVVDLVFAWEVIEHFDDPSAFLAAARGICAREAGFSAARRTARAPGSVGLELNGTDSESRSTIAYTSNSTSLRRACARHGFGDIATLTCVDWRSDHLLRHTATELAKRYLGTNDIRVRRSAGAAGGQSRGSPSCCDKAECHR